MRRSRHLPSRSSLALASIAVLAATGVSHAAPTATPLAVFTKLLPLHACAPGADGEVLLAGHGGLWRVDARGRVQQRLTRLAGLPGTRVHSVLQHDKLVVVGTEAGLAVLLRGKDGALKVVARRRGKPVRALARHRGKLFLGRWGAGLASLRWSTIEALARGKTTLPAPRSTAGPGARLRVTTLHVYGSALLVGTAGKGLWHLGSAAKASLQRHRASATLPSPFVWALAARKGQLVAATLAGLVELTPHQRWSSLSSADVRAMRSEGKDTLLLASFGKGLGRLDAAGKLRWNTRPGRFIGTLGGGHGRLCGGGKGGAFLLSRGSPLATTRILRLASSISSNDLSALARAGDTIYLGSFDGGLTALTASRAPRRVRGVDGRIDALCVSHRRGKPHWLWIGTMRGLYRLELAGKDRGKVRRFGRVDGLPHDHVHALAVLKSGRVAVGTSRGLAFVSLRDGETMTTIGRKQGLPVDAIWALAEGRDRHGAALWIGTSKGLYRWALRGGYGYQRYSVASGHLSDDWITALVTHGAVLFAGTYNAGVVRLEATAPKRAPARTKPSYAAARLGGGWINFGGLRVVSSGAAKNTFLLAATMAGLKMSALNVPEPAVQLMAPTAKVALGKDVTGTLAAPDGSLWIASRRGLSRQPATILPRIKDPDGC